MGQEARPGRDLLLRSATMHEVLLCIFHTRFGGGIFPSCSHWGISPESRPLTEPGIIRQSGQRTLESMEKYGKKYGKGESSPPVGRPACASTMLRAANQAVLIIFFLPLPHFRHCYHPKKKTFPAAGTASRHSCCRCFGSEPQRASPSFSDRTGRVPEAAREGVLKQTGEATGELSTSPRASLPGPINVMGSIPHAVLPTCLQPWLARAKRCPAVLPAAAPKSTFKNKNTFGLQENSGRVAVLKAPGLRCAASSRKMRSYWRESSGGLRG